MANDAFVPIGDLEPESGAGARGPSTPGDYVLLAHAATATFTQQMIGEPGRAAVAPGRAAPSTAIQQETTT